MTSQNDMLAIGELAKKAGISVRALRHYEAIGLLHPARDPHNERRRYGRADIETVMQITALKGAGFSLRRIGALLGGGVDMSTLVQAQLRHMRALQSRTRMALDVLEQAAGLLQKGQRLDVDLLCHMIRSTPMTTNPLSDVAKDYFDDEQMAKIKARGTTPDELADYGRQWSDLIARVQQLVDAGADPASPEAQACAQQWQGLVEAFTQNDPGITQSLGKMYADKEAWKGRAQMPYSPPVGDFIARAGRARKEHGRD